MDINKFRKSFKNGVTIIKQGDVSNETFILIKGSVKVLKDDREVTTISESGSFIGEIGALLNEKRTANVVTTQDSEFLIVSPDEFKRLIENDSEIGLRLAKSLAKRLKQTTQKVNDTLY